MGCRRSNRKRPRSFHKCQALAVSLAAYERGITRTTKKELVAPPNPSKTSASIRVTPQQIT